VIQAVAVTPLPKAPTIVLGIIDIRGAVIPVINMRERFNHPRRNVYLSDHLIIATTGKRTVALLVDETKGVITASTERISVANNIVPGLGFIAGTLRLADGLVLIHDLDLLLSLEEEKAIDRALSANADIKCDEGNLHNDKNQGEDSKP
jgi:purine-binding chemotaxis protein CheW